ncbi:MAG: 2-isopropylmalate synthase [Calditrichaeota bacterium]|nr:2-isopropylmalate synthase [Calditrichota bacterium]
MIKVLDSTLREGEQTPGVYFDGHIKLAIADLLDEIGIEIIEAGHPIVTEDIHHAVHQIARKNLKAIVAAHSRSLKQDVELALECGVQFIGIFYSVTNERLDQVFRKDLKTAVRQITEVIRYAKDQKPELLIRYTPEDTVRSPFENVIEAAGAAVEAGADIISVADTTGFMVPGTGHNMYDYISRLKEALDQRGLSPMIAVHCHNDRGFALTNALDGMRAGAEIIDASVLGLGERAGIVDLAQLLAALKDIFRVPNEWDLTRLPELYDLISKYSGMPVPKNFPITGENAFTHCAGVHTHAAVQNPVHYQSLDPALVGREMDVALDHMSGISSVRWALDRLQIEYDNELLKDLLSHIKSIGLKGRTVHLSELKHLVEWCIKHPLKQ